MSGHSKWKNIMHKKEKADSQRAKVFTKIGREISVCVKQGGPDPAANSKLRDLIVKARSNNVPMDNIDRLIKKASGDGAADNYEDITYEGYGPCGVAIIVEALTDNRNRTAGDMRHYFDKYGGNLGQSGSVGWMFKRRGELVIEAEDKDADTVMEAALECGAEDFEDDGEVFTVVTSEDGFGPVRDAMEKAGDEFLEADVVMSPTTWTKIEDEELTAKMEKLLELLEEHDDVQNVWHNWDEE
ncbi:Transcriptional regulatory protein PmpR [bioreactor metagenome]|uniref:Transcriptional regulatory protein PmpR n=1 Tax=bioreactor metagenome TaxID=1076179 RepID=A0A644YJ23_9ZZZZ